MRAFPKARMNKISVLLRIRGQRWEPAMVSCGCVLRLRNPSRDNALRCCLEPMVRHRIEWAALNISRRDTNEGSFDPGLCRSAGFGRNRVRADEPAGWQQDQI